MADLKERQALIEIKKRKENLSLNSIGILPPFPNQQQSTYPWA